MFPGIEGRGIGQRLADFRGRCINGRGRRVHDDSTGRWLASITLLLVAYLVAAGLGDLFMALQLRPAEGWSLMLFNGIVTLLLGMMLWRQFPLSGAWAIGVLFGIKMIFSGWALVFIGRNVKQAATSFES